MEQYSFLEGSYYMANLGSGLASTHSNSVVFFFLGAIAP